jgi:hypothetical protein
MLNITLEDVAEEHFVIVQNEQYGCTISNLLQFSEEKYSQLSPNHNFQGNCHKKDFLLQLEKRLQTQIEEMHKSTQWCPPNCNQR